MNKDIQRKKFSAFNRWFLSYLMILGMVLILSVVLYCYAYKIVSEITGETVEVQLESMRTEFDSYIGSGKEIINYLHLDANVVKAVVQNKNFTVPDQELLIAVNETLINKASSSDPVDSISIFLGEGQRILSTRGNMSIQLFYELYYESEEMSYEEFITLLGEQWVYDIYFAKNSSGEDILWILDNADGMINEEVKSTLIVTFNSEEFNERSLKYKSSDGVEAFVLHENGQIMGLENGENEAYFENLESGWWKASRIKDVNGQMMSISYIESDTTSLKYVILYPLKVASAAAYGIQMVMIIGVIICIAVVTLISYLLAKNQYKSLKTVMDVFGKYDLIAGDQEKDEFQWIKDKGLLILLEQQKLKRQKDASDDLLLQQSLYRFLTLPLESNQLLLESGRLSRLENKKFYIVGLLYIKDLPVEIDRVLYCFIIENILNEVTNANYRFQLVDLGDSMGIIGYADESFLENRALFEAELLEFEQGMRKVRGSEIEICFGSEVNHMNELYNSYKKANEVVGYQSNDSTQLLSWYDDIKTIPAFYQYSLEEEERLIHLLLVKDMEGAKRLIEEIVKKKKLSESLLQCLQIEMKGTFIKAAQQTGLSSYLESLQNDMEPYKSLNENKLIEIFHINVEIFCKELEEKKEITQNDKNFSNRVKEYVEEQYHDPDLNISITALHFAITPSYLSTLFKEETNMSLLDYINRTRIQHGKLLLQENYSIVEIATKVGYRNSGSFIRTFKKLTGITPGQYKSEVIEIN